MFKFSKQLVVSSVLLAVVGLATPASATVTVDFTFTSTIGQIGVVTGKLVFLTTGTNVAASEVYVLTAPTGTVNDATFGTDYLAGSPSVTSNSFSLAADGTVTAANLYMFNASLTDFINLGDNSNGRANMVSNQKPGGLFALIQGGFAGATYSVEAPVGGVPEAATWAMMIVGFGTVGVAMRRRVARETGALAA